MIKHFLIFYILLFNSLSVFAQNEFVLDDDKDDKIRFQLINNLIVFPVEINGVELSFLFDTGVSKPIIFNLVNFTEELHIKETEIINIRGLGEGNTIEAIKSKNNYFKIGNAVNLNQELYAIYDPSLNFAPKLGVPIHGIIGYDFLKNFVVEINYSKKFIRINNPKYYEPRKCKNCESFELEFYNNKPYIKGIVELNNKTIPVKLLIDSGGSDALWLFEDKKQNIETPNAYFIDFLGRGLSGSVYGKRSKVKRFSIGSFNLKNVNTAFPDSASIRFARNFKSRSGSLAGDILKRFNIVFDYPNKKIRLKRNRYFSDPFNYNKSGIILEHDGVRLVKEIQTSIKRSDESASAADNRFIMMSGSYDYILVPSYTIVELREDSPAKESGLMVGDIVLAINNKHAHKYSLQEIMAMFYDDAGKNIKLLVDRNGVQLKYSFKLKDML
ncbi:MAG: PDZ domain-containing protein [Flavobacteriaceae bacterium]|nr:PDZ domain-containing protein [Flavobacteriaceae bacterium]